MNTATKTKKNEELFYALLRAQNENEVAQILNETGMLANDDDWKPLGDTENNWSAAGNQQSAAAAALVEKMINGIDAVLMYECWKRKIDPTSPKAPQSMAEAAKQFFNVPNGRLENVPKQDRTELAKRVQIMAVGSKDQPSYVVIDTGEGQSPADFSDTFLSLAKSNKLHIQFVQGKYNAGGTGALRFCGHENYQLIASRRAPGLPVKKQDASSGDWGFTLIRRLRPSEGNSHPFGKRKISSRPRISSRRCTKHFSARSG